MDDPRLYGVTFILLDKPAFSQSEDAMRVLSGIQSSGKLHLGNYLGAMKQHIELQHKHECFYSSPIIIR